MSKRKAGFVALDVVLTSEKLEETRSSSSPAAIPHLELCFLPRMFSTYGTSFQQSRDQKKYYYVSSSKNSVQQSITEQRTRRNNAVQDT
jgi:hypothetical protein